MKKAANQRELQFSVIRWMMFTFTDVIIGTDIMGYSCGWDLDLTVTMYRVCTVFSRRSKLIALFSGLVFLGHYE